MVEIEIHWPEDMPVTDMITNIEACCSAINLTQTMRGTLGKYPGCTHWHYKNGKAKGVDTPRGVLEITLWPKQHRLWLVVHENRKADWIDETASQLKAAIEARFYER
jgi:hypothetical protein